MNVILLGPQGSGKGTQAQALKAALGIVHIASGDVIRAARQADTELGRLVNHYYVAGELVPDDVMIQLLLETMHAAPPDADILLDGFPRTLPQAQALDAALEQQRERIDLVIELVAPLETVKARLAGRRICRICGAVYNVQMMPPAVPGVCDLDGGELYQRDDDYPEAIEKRLAIWAQENSRLVGYYAPRGVLVQVDADREPEVITKDIVALLRKRHAA